MWQFWVEIEYYFVAYFDRIAVQSAKTQHFCYGWGSYILLKLDTFTKHV